LSAAVIAGHDRDCAAAVPSVNQADRRRVCGVDSASRSTARQLRRHLAERLEQLGAGAGPYRAARLLLLAEPPSIDPRP